MADIFDFYVYDNRSIVHTSPEPIMQEDKDVAVWRFRIPKVLNNIDMSAWAWWFVYVNAKGQKFSKELMVGPDYDEPGVYNSAEISIDHGISIYPGNFTFALEAIEAVGGGGTIIGEWHTYTYTHKVVGTLQGNQAEYAETEHDIISALITEYQNLHVGTNQITDGAVTFAKLANDAVTSVKIADGAVTNEKLASNSVSTANVQDGAITEAKLADALKLELVKNYITPEMYGAVGDGVTNDSTAIRTASQHGVVIGDKDKTYFIGTDCHISNSIANINFIVDKSATISAEKDDLFIANCTFENNEFYPDTGRGFWILSITGSKNIVIENCYFGKGVSAVYIDRCSDMKIRNNIFEDFRQYGLSAGGNGYGILLIETQNVIISNNIFRDVARHSVYISHDSTSTYCENILIDGNIFEWDSAVVGNTTGFEVTISIRPAKYVTISNNLFLSMFAVCEFAVQEIYVDGTLTSACSQHVTINNNKGSFANHPRHSNTGVIFAPADETYSTLVAVSDVVISNNVFTIEKGVFVCCNALNDVCIKNNVITFELKTDSHVFCAPSPKQNGLFKTIIFDGNRIEGAYTLFRISNVAQNVDNLIIANNHIDVTALANCVSGTTFKQIKIINNDIVSENDRTYFSSATVEKITLKGNTSNKRISLYLVATSVLSTDPCFIGYGFNSSNPPDCVAGAIHTWYSGQIYIMGADGNWHLIT